MAAAALSTKVVVTSGRTAQEAMAQAMAVARLRNVAAIALALATAAASKRESSRYFGASSAFSSVQRR